MLVLCPAIATERLRYGRLLAAHPGGPLIGAYWFGWNLEGAFLRGFLVQDGVWSILLDF